ncbi:MAG: hypothetical protein Q4P66_08705 [Actinomycetaceae bacterium]|nr:hypothetical protein [Actinomycetaceae bacterium]
MTRYFFFPDNTVLINFTYLQRHDLLEWFVKERGRWTQSVRRECEQSSRVDGLERMTHWSSVFGDPFIPDRAELIDVAIIVDSMRKPGDKNTAHLGEAETIAIICKRNFSALFLTDDHGAARSASRNSIKVIGTGKIIAYAEVAGIIEHGEAHSYLCELHTLNRVLRHPHSIEEYDACVAELRGLKKRLN